MLRVAVPVVDALTAQGIVQVAPLYDDQELSFLASALDPVFAERAHEHRSYVRADELCRRGLLDAVFNAPMVSLIRTLLPQPQLYHCLINEIAANQQKPHVNGSLLNGWHRDEDTIERYAPGEPLHVSIFVYLTDVSPNSGAFELMPSEPNRRQLNGAPSIKVHGRRGTSFVWNRSFYHRASPNSGPTRRRLLKLSLQTVGTPNGLVDSDEFRAVRANTRPGTFVGQLFGHAPAPVADAVEAAAISVIPLAPNSRVGVSRKDLATDWALEAKSAVLTKTLDALGR